MSHPDLFSVDTRAEARPTDLEAAKQRRRLLAEYRKAPDGLTADQASARAGLTPFSGRPRVTELYKGGFLETTGEKRLNRSGKPARVLRSVK